MTNTTKFTGICLLIAATIVMVVWAFAIPAPATPGIAGTEVPDNLSCQEDEVISLLPSPYAPGVDYDAIGCVHIDTIREGR